jgi:hypothetical protein
MVEADKLERTRHSMTPQTDELASVLARRLYDAADFLHGHIIDVDIIDEKRHLAELISWAGLAVHRANQLQRHLLDKKGGLA